MWSKMRSSPLLACTDAPDVLSLRPLIDCPLILVAGAAPERDANSPGQRRQLTWGASSVTCSPDHDQDIVATRKCISQLGEHYDLEEPFGRIREAVEEAQKSAPRAA